MHAAPRVDDLAGKAARPERRVPRACHAVAVRGPLTLTGAALLAAIVLPGPVPAARAAVPAGGWATDAGVRVERDVVLRPGAVRDLRLPARRWALSATVRAVPGSALRVTTPAGRLVVDLRAGGDGRLTVRTAAGGPRTLAPAAAARRWTHRLELVRGPRGALAVDGRRIPVAAVGPVRLASTGRRAVGLTALTVTPTARRDALLLHRLGDLRSRTARGRFPLGEGDDGRLRFSGGWTSGFWPGALWAAADLAPRGPYADWALDASLDRIGGEDTPIHDVGFMFGRSVVAAYARRCRAGAATAQCRRLRASGLAAADTLVRLSATAASGMIPTDATGPEADTIIDSVMNLGLLTWATRVSGRERYAQLAGAHARRVQALLQRADGSTIQLAVHDRATGALLRLGTRQGLADTSTWARGQAWAIYGLADVGGALGDRALVSAAERAARFWAATAPARRTPPYDLLAGAAAPRDSSAAAIAAAGMYRLADACARLPGACGAPERWTAVARGTLDTALSAVSSAPPLGRLGGQAYAVGPRHGSWDDHAELIWGLDFALEAVAARYGRSKTGGR